LFLKVVYPVSERITRPRSNWDDAVKVLGDGNDSFHRFTHGLGLGEQPFFDRLGAPLKNPCSRYVVDNRLLWLCRGQERRRKWKDEVPAIGHDKELFFRKWGGISGLGVYPSLCELVERIVTVRRVRQEPIVGRA
jgi:hypothetical protein